ncbi:hypothetical protein AV521_30745 [Streptomyces sp. IMTB 2501]|nr:hypothetical protein AV521_30745 [Streptomyces sp. IMTB 2501]
MRRLPWALGFAQAHGLLFTQLTGLGEDARMVSLSATSRHAGLAAGIATAVAGSPAENADRSVRGTGVRLVRLSLALTPAQPSSASRGLTALMGAGGPLGGLAGTWVPAPVHSATSKSSWDERVRWLAVGGVVHRRARVRPLGEKWAWPHRACPLATPFPKGAWVRRGGCRTARRAACSSSPCTGAEC